MSILETSCVRTASVYPTGKFSSLVFTIRYERMNSFYIRNIVLPNAVLLALSSLTFFIPNNLGERVSFGITVTLALCVNLIIVIDFIPETSKTIPNICNYFLVSIFLSGFSIMLAMISINISFWLQSTNLKMIDHFQKLTNTVSVATMSSFLISDDVQNKSRKSSLKRDSVATILEQEKIKNEQEEVKRRATERRKERLAKAVRIFDGVLGMSYLIATTLYTVLFINQ